MKIPESWKKESTHATMGVNTMSLIGLSLTWGHMLELISIWFLPLTLLTLLAGFGNEVRKPSEITTGVNDAQYKAGYDNIKWSKDKPKATFKIRVNGKLINPDEEE